MKDKTHTCYYKLSKSKNIAKNVKSIKEFSSSNYDIFHKTEMIAQLCIICNKLKRYKILAIVHKKTKNEWKNGKIQKEQ